MSSSTISLSGVPTLHLSTHRIALSIHLHQRLRQFIVPRIYVFPARRIARSRSSNRSSADAASLSPSPPPAPFAFHQRHLPITRVALARLQFDHLLSRALNRQCITGARLRPRLVRSSEWPRARRGRQPSAVSNSATYRRIAANSLAHRLTLQFNRARIFHDTLHRRRQRRTLARGTSSNPAADCVPSRSIRRARVDVDARGRRSRRLGRWFGVRIVLRANDGVRRRRSTCAGVRSSPKAENKNRCLPRLLPLAAFETSAVETRVAIGFARTRVTDRSRAMVTLGDVTAVTRALFVGDSAVAPSRGVRPPESELPRLAPNSAPPSVARAHGRHRFVVRDSERAHHVHGADGGASTLSQRQAVHQRRRCLQSSRTARLAATKSKQKSKCAPMSPSGASRTAHVASKSSGRTHSAVILAHGQHGCPPHRRRARAAAVRHSPHSAPTLPRNTPFVTSTVEKRFTARARWRAR